MAKKLGFILFFLLLASVFSFPQSSTVSGQVTISYTFSHLFRRASNQYAIWIEDEKGSFIRTLFATDFVARRAGWKSRPQTVPMWIKAADVRHLSQKDIDAISGATPRNGSYKVVWDLRDSKGHLVSPGTYRYFVEGNIFWENRVLWSGTITLGSKPQVSQAAATYSGADAQKIGTLISEVSASYEP